MHQLFHVLPPAVALSMHVGQDAVNVCSPGCAETRHSFMLVLMCSIQSGCLTYSDVLVV